MKDIDALLSTEMAPMKMVATFLREYSSNHNWDRVEETQRPIDQCWHWIVNQARKLSTNQCAMVDDATVYKWALDFYNAAEVKDVPTAPVKTVKVETPKPKVEKPAVEKKVVQDEQLSLFD